MEHGKHEGRKHKENCFFVYFVPSFVPFVLSK